jgi:hypothetical protein
MVGIFQDATHCGFLLKKGQVNKAYQRRYFKLRGKYLYYFKSQEDLQPKGSIALSNVDIKEDPKKKWQFILAGNSLPRMYELTAESEEEYQEWLQHIRTVAESK